MEALHRNGSELPTVTMHLPRRMRFSLRVLFIATSVVAAMTYLLVVRPTVVAKRFVAAINKGDFAEARVRLNDQAALEFQNAADRSIEVDRVFAELAPRDSSDIWRCRRRVTLDMQYRRESGGQRVDWLNRRNLTVGTWDIREDSFESSTKTVNPAAVELPTQNEQFRMPDYTLVP